MSQAFCCAEKGARLSHELRPTVLGDLGLKPALEFPAEGVSKRTKQRITVEGFKGERLPASIETALYRIVQEALNNAAKHARATRVTIRLRQPPTYGKRRHSVLSLRRAR